MSLLARALSVPEKMIWTVYSAAQQTPKTILFLIFNILCMLALCLAFLVLHLIAPKPREPFASEKKYITTNEDGSVSTPRPLPCWYDRWRAEHVAQSVPGLPEEFPPREKDTIEPAEVEISVVIPAYNEEERIQPTLEEMVEYLDKKFGRPETTQQQSSGSATSKSKKSKAPNTVSGYEIIIVNDGSKDKTVEVALELSKRHKLHDVLRIVTLEKNRGKGGGVTHGLRHVRGKYALFADADGASRFCDVEKLIDGCDHVLDGSKRGVAIGSRGHLVGSEAVVKRSMVRNFLMRSFHAVLMILTPPATSRIHDTQCGFKLFSRAALPHIVPYMHAEGWIFDIEMLMLAESAPASPVRAKDGSVIGSSCGIKVAEIPIHWHEVGGSKMNLMQDSIKMALGLAVLRASWMSGVYRRRLT